MEQTKQTGIFREKTLERISSPEQLTDYLHGTRPGAWMILLVCVLLLAALLICAAIGTLETDMPVRLIVSDHTAEIVLLEAGTLSEGMPIRVGGAEYQIQTVTADAYGRPVAMAELPLPDGSYDGIVITEQIRPLSFLLRP